MAASESVRFEYECQFGKAKKGYRCEARGTLCGGDSSESCSSTLGFRCKGGEEFWAADAEPARAGINDVAVYGRQGTVGAGIEFENALDAPSAILTGTFSAELGWQKGGPTAPLEVLAGHCTVRRAD